MGQYLCIIRGWHCRSDFDEGRALHGFYTHRILEASGIEEARGFAQQEVWRRVRDDESVLNRNSARLRLSVPAIIPIEWSGRKIIWPELALFEEKDRKGRRGALDLVLKSAKTNLPRRFSKLLSKTRHRLW